MVSMHHLWFRLVSQNRPSPLGEGLRKCSWRLFFQNPSRKSFTNIFYFFWRFGLFQKLLSIEGSFVGEDGLPGIRTSRLAQNLLQICQKAKIKSFLVLVQGLHHNLHHHHYHDEKKICFQQAAAHDKL